MTQDSAEKTIEILLVEDNPADVRLTQEGGSESKHSVNVSVAGDGEAAMAHLRQEGDQADAPRPDLIILDVILPKMSGWDLLAELEASPDLGSIPLVILAGNIDQSLLQTYRIPRSRAWPKPIELDRFNWAIENLHGRVMQLTPKPQPQEAPADSSAETAQAKKRSWWPFGR